MQKRLIIDGYAKSFLAQKEIAERAFRQLDDKGIHWRPRPGLNTVAILIKHLSGHLKSRFLDFLVSDGEKVDRDRVGELNDDSISLRNLEDMWNESWAIVLAVMDDLVDDDLSRTKELRGQKLLVAEYLPRVLVHTSYHTGQIVLLAKQYCGDNWQMLE